MRLRVGNVECPKCGHTFEYDSGSWFMKGFETKEEAEKNKHSETDIVEYYGEIGWVIVGGD